MSYVDKHLLFGETVVFRTHLHWKIYMSPLFMLLLGIAACFFGEPVIIYAIVYILIIPIPMSIGAFIKRKTSEFAVTDKRVIIKVGFISRTSMEVLLTKIESVTVAQSIPGRVFRYGTIVVGGTGAAKGLFVDVANPIRFRAEVQGQIEKKERAEPAVSANADGR